MSEPDLLRAGSASAGVKSAGARVAAIVGMILAAASLICCQRRDDDVAGIHMSEIRSFLDQTLARGPVDMELGFQRNGQRLRLYHVSDPKEIRATVLMLRDNLNAGDFLAECNNSLWLRYPGAREFVDELHFGPSRNDESARDMIIFLDAVTATAESVDFDPDFAESPRWKQ